MRHLCPTLTVSVRLFLARRGTPHLFRSVHAQEVLLDRDAETLEGFLALLLDFLGLFQFLLPCLGHARHEFLACLELILQLSLADCLDLTRRRLVLDELLLGRQTRVPRRFSCKRRGSSVGSEGSSDRSCYRHALTERLEFLFEFANEFRVRILVDDSLVLDLLRLIAEKSLLRSVDWDPCRLTARNGPKLTRNEGSRAFLRSRPGKSLRSLPSSNCLRANLSTARSRPGVPSRSEL